MGATASLKRIAGLPGDDITLFGPKLELSMRPASAPTEVGIHVPSGHVFVLGDNAAVSRDSRAWGPVPIQSIGGLVLTVLSRHAV